MASNGQLHSVSVGDLLYPNYVLPDTIKNESLILLDALYVLLFEVFDKGSRRCFDIIPLCNAFANEKLRGKQERQEK